MANFTPLKSYMLQLVDECVEKHAVHPPFLDAGCGQGDVSLHFAKKGWSGKALDFSRDAAAAAKNTLRSYANVEVAHQALRDETGIYRCAFLLDVLEHEKDDDAMMEYISGRIGSDGFLFVSVPVHPEEWAWDDEFYGHYRRYKIYDMLNLFSRHGLEPVEILNLTYPFFWILRKFYLRALPRKILQGTPEERTKLSATHNAYGRNIWTELASVKLMWLPVFHVQRRLKYSSRGFELLFVAQKK